jgi:hypothetical protein
MALSLRSRHSPSGPFFLVSGISQRRRQHARHNSDAGLSEGEVFRANVKISLSNGVSSNATRA